MISRRSLLLGGSLVAGLALAGCSSLPWHPRRDTDPAAMVLREFLPLLAARGLRTQRVGLLGNSMGAYGALYLATVLGRARTAAVVAESPAIWHHAAQTVDGSFDDAADFAAHSIFGRVRRLRGIPLRFLGAHLG